MANMNAAQLIAALAQMSPEDKANVANALGVQVPTGTYAWEWQAVKGGVDQKTQKPYDGYSKLRLNGPNLSKGMGALSHRPGAWLDALEHVIPMLDLIGKGVPADSLRNGETVQSLAARAKTLRARLK